MKQPATLAHEIRELTLKMGLEGWDRMRGLRLLGPLTEVAQGAATQVIPNPEAVGRAAVLVETLQQLVHEVPSSERLTRLLAQADALADCLEQGGVGGRQMRESLPTAPELCSFVLIGEVAEELVLAATLTALGFSVILATSFEAALAVSSNAILVARVSWVIAHRHRLSAERQRRAETMPLLVAIVAADPFPLQVKARRAGARLLLESPLEARRLVDELEGLAWQPYHPYRVLLVDDDQSLLDLHTYLLQQAGFEVLAVADPLQAWDRLDQFAPDVCLLDVEMPICRGTDLAALLRTYSRFAHLPVIYLSGFVDIEHQIDARYAGGEDYLTKPVDARLLRVAVLSRARQFRRLARSERQREEAGRDRDQLRASLDDHALVTIAAADGTIIEANDRFCAVNGYRREELLGRNHNITRSGHHPPEFFAQMWQQIHAGQIWQGELKNRNKEGGYYWVQTTIRPILDTEGVVQRYMAIRTDITEQKRAVAEQERQGRLLDLLRQVLHTFLTHHNFTETSRLLLDGMLLLTESNYGFLGEVLEDKEGGRYLKTHAISNIAWDEASQQLYAQASAEGMEFRNLNTLFGAVLRTGATVIANDPPSDPRRGGLPTGHPPINAFLGLPIYKGTHLIGMVGLANRPGGYDENCEAFLSTFTATYAAILEAVQLRHYQQQMVAELQQAHDRMEQTQQQRTTQMAEVRGQIETQLKRLSGDARVLLLSDGLTREARQEAQRLVQSCEHLFPLLDELFTLPTSAEVEIAPVVSTTPLPTRGRILVAEDHPANQALLKMQMEVLGLKADMVSDGAAALGRWQKGGYALLLVDRNMPGMNGLELTRAIRAQERERGGHIPIIAITAASQPEELALCLQAGMDAVLPKPIELADLQRMLEQWLPAIPSIPPLLPRIPPPTLPPLPAPVAQGDASAVLDLDYLATIIGHAAPEACRQLIDLFTTTARSDLQAAQQRFQQGDAGELALLTHKLKSSARMVGALRFARLAEVLEQQAKVETLTACAPLLRDMEYALNDVEQALGSLKQTSVAVDLPVSKPRWSGDGNSFGLQQVLIVDDDPVARQQWLILFNGLGVTTAVAVDSAMTALLELAGRDPIDLLITDLNMPEMDGIEFLRQLAERNYRGDLILSSGVEEQLIQTAAEFARACSIPLLGTLKKPVTQERLLQLLFQPLQRPANRVAPPPLEITPERLRQGIARDEFEIYFQPKVEATTLRAVAVEALARWSHNGQPIPPDRFILAAEEQGLIGELSKILITKALADGQRLNQAGFPLAVAVNISANWLSDRALPEFILNTLQQAGFRSDHLILELTETGVMIDRAASLDVMSRLRLKGFKLSIDDFGMGYSSLEQLQRFPFGELKLDRSLVRGAVEKGTTRAILASTLEMARQLRLTTVAEGVETEADLDLVRGLGCDLVQGWLIARAMPVERLIEWLQKRSR